MLSAKRHCQSSKVGVPNGTDPISVTVKNLTALAEDLKHKACYKLVQIQSGKIFRTEYFLH